MMLLSKTEVANEVARILGHTTTISDLDTDTRPLAMAIKRVYQRTMMQTLQFRWRVLTRRVELELLKKHPNKNWAYAYAYPSNAAVVLGVDRCDYIGDSNFSRPDLMPKYTVEKIDDYTVALLTNVPKAWAGYIEMPAENDAFDYNVGLAFAANLAMAVAPTMITNNYFTVKEKLEEECDKQRSEAQANDIGLVPERDNQYAPSLAFSNHFDY
jgi:hypothetical protein